MNFSAIFLSLLDRLSGRSYRSPSSDETRHAVLAVCANDNRDTRTKLYRILLDGIFIVPKADYPRLEHIDSDPGRNIAFPLVELGQAVKGLPIFTSTGELRTWLPAGCGYVLMQGQNLFLMAAELNAKAVAVNPGCYASGVLIEWEIRRLAEGVVPVPQEDRSLPGGIKGHVVWEALEEPLPVSFLDEARILLTKQPEVESAYALRASFNFAPDRLVLAVSCPVMPGDERLSEFMPGLVNLAESHRLDAYCVVVEQHPWLAEVHSKISTFMKRKG
jgi:hypothetical protein